MNGHLKKNRLLRDVFELGPPVVTELTKLNKMQQVGISYGLESFLTNFFFA